MILSDALAKKPLDKSNDSSFIAVRIAWVEDVKMPVLLAIGLYKK